MMTDLMGRLFGRGARIGSLGIRDALGWGRQRLGWTRAHQGAREILRRQRQAAAKAAKRATEAL